MTAAATPRRKGSHGVYTYSRRTRRKVIAALVEKALAGDASAAALVLSMSKPLADEPATGVLSGK
jgi:hypothetical protein